MLSSVFPEIMGGPLGISVIIQPLIEKDLRSIHLHCDDRCHLTPIGNREKWNWGLESMYFICRGPSDSPDHATREHSTGIPSSSSFLKFF